MEITEVRVKLMEDSDDRLRAFCSITFDDRFVIRDLKIIEGTNGPFVAMPSRKLTSHCPGCGCKNHLRAAYCNLCGLRLKDDRAIRDQEGRAKLYADIAHPINSTCREMIQNRVIEEFQSEQTRSTEPGYMSRYDDDFDLDYEYADDSATPAPVEPEKVEPEKVESKKVEPVEATAPLNVVATQAEEETGHPDGKALHADSAQEPQGPHKNRAARTQIGQSDDEFGVGIF
jgi:stage V sporulation protein G